MFALSRVHRHIISISLVAACMVWNVTSVAAQEKLADPLTPLFEPAIRPAINVLLEDSYTRRTYPRTKFPLRASQFAQFRRQVIGRLEESLDLGDWTVRHPDGKKNALAGKFRDQVLAAITHDGIRMEVHAVELVDTGLVVPMVICLPDGEGVHPGVCVFSGHTRHGLRELVLDLNSYQRGLATRLAKAGFVAIAVEKIDSGYLSRDGVAGSDEEALASLLLGTARPTRAHQLMACVAASEILAMHPRVREDRIGAAGVSLGGWLSIQTALLTQRIRAVADFGVKTRLLPDPSTEDFKGVGDICHVLPGLFALGDRDLLPLAYAPRPLLAGHGRLDVGSERDGPRYFREVLRSQYEALGRAHLFEYAVHERGDVMPVELVVDYLRRRLVNDVESVSESVGHLQGEMSGEVSATSVILQSRLTTQAVSATGDAPGVSGAARFEYATNPDFSASFFTDWLQATAQGDGVVKTKVHGLEPGSRYYYRLHYGLDKQQTEAGPTRSFRTHFPAKTVASHSFVVVTGMNYHYFHFGLGKRRPYSGPDRDIGYPALASILRLKPDFFVGTGDNVYYDAPRVPSAVDEASMRKKWHEQFIQPLYVELFGEVPTYWEKDDHDYRYDDCDNTSDKEPSVDLGLRIFREQVPVTDPEDPHAVTYRTYRAGRLLQIWLPENRDYRSANLSADGPDKTIWGAEQRAWLKRTLLESDAVFKVIVSPTPMIGPDDLRKKDNHCDIGGFRHEGDEFFRWAKDNGFLQKGLFFACGDRHWQYHSVHPSGFEEFSSGALVDSNSRLGVRPGDANGTDPEARIEQPYTSREPSGGFLRVVVEPSSDSQVATVAFEFYDENGVQLHRVERRRAIAER